MSEGGRTEWGRPQCRELRGHEGCKLRSPAVQSIRFWWLAGMLSTPGLSAGLRSLPSAKAP